ncbi:MAG TPA: GAF domain-containing protein, partial [Candidatus Angelobacter sp.]|nr:GAF domain-containing protein [Candidatus Angelobacter sp.]
MRPKPKARKFRAKAPSRASACMENVLAACTELANFSGEPPILRRHIAEAARRIFQSMVAGVMVQQDATFLTASTAVHDMAEEDVAAGQHHPAGKDHSADKNALLEHARSFAIQAIEQKRLLTFRFSYRSPEGESVYHGLAQPISTTKSAAVLLVVRRNLFSPAEISAFSMLGGTARLALDNSELAGLYSTQTHDYDQLLEISAELGTSRLEGFFPGFVVRAADFLGFSRAFIALTEAGKCHLRWAAGRGSASRLDIDISAVAKRAFESPGPHICEDIGQLMANEKAQLRRWESDLKQYLGMPLLTSDGRQLGVLGFFDKKNKARISPDDLRRARVLAAEITVALEAAHNLQLSDQHRKRTEDLMEMALDLGSALRLPDFVKNFTERVAGMIGAQSAILSLAQGNKVESVGFYGPKPERELQRKLNAA